SETSRWFAWWSPGARSSGGGVIVTPVAARVNRLSRPGAACPPGRRGVGYGSDRPGPGRVAMPAFDRRLVQPTPAAVAQALADAAASANKRCRQGLLDPDGPWVGPLAEAAC